MAGRLACRRRSILSYPRPQMRLVGLFLLLALAYGAVNGYVTTAALYRLIEDVAHLPLSSETRADLQVLARQHARTLYAQMMLFTALTLLMVVLGALLVSHRVAGPVRRLSRYLRGLAQQSVTPERICFRKHDFWHELAEDFNRFQEVWGILPSGDKAPKRASREAPSDPAAPPETERSKDSPIGS